MNDAQRFARGKASEVAIHGVYEATKILARSASLDRSLPQVLALLLDFLELSDVGVVLFDQEGEWLVGATGAEEPTPRMAALLRAALQRVRRTGMPWIVESEYVDPDLLTTPSSADMGFDLSFVCVPLKDQEGIQGALCIERLHSHGDQASFCFDDDVRLLSVLANVIAQTARLERSSTTRAVRNPSSEPSQPPDVSSSGPPMIGRSAVWLDAVEKARTAARTSATVLLRGESGTGKELLARLIHHCSPRRDRAFVSINCAALSRTVLESELFGHEKGAFTGAVSQRKGRFELADGGTLFLDEIGEVSPSFQALLLRVLQLGEFERVGGTSTLKVDVRVVAATNRNLEADVRAGKFRADLYYRISVVPIRVPALRERPQDIALLAQEFLRRYNASNGTNLSLSSGALDALSAYAFPGNVRELENALRRAATLSRRCQLAAEDFGWLKEETALTLALARPDMATPGVVAPGPLDAGEMPGPSDPADSERNALLARDRLVAALERAGWVQAKAARLLGLTPRQIAYAVQKYEIALRKL